MQLYVHITWQGVSYHYTDVYVLCVNKTKTKHEKLNRYYRKVDTIFRVAEIILLIYDRHCKAHVMMSSFKFVIYNVF